jgi:hypothetical protein
VIPAGTPAEAAAQRWFAELGGPHLIYVRPADATGLWEVHAADGALLGIFRTREIALCAARRRGYEAVTAH